MGGNSSSEKITENQQIITEVTQISEQFCNIGCNQNIDGTTIISINQVGDINVTQMATISAKLWNYKNIILEYRNGI